MSDTFADLLSEVRLCRRCVEHPQGAPLPVEPRPILAASETSRIVIIGQAPGRRVWKSGVAWDDPSGVRLRGWLGLSDEQFYDPALVALIPMGFCYPGKGTSGDLPPRHECAPLWHDRILSRLPTDRLDVIIGQYAQRRYTQGSHRSVTETVSAWRSFLPDRIVLPHPSPRNVGWFKANPWFEAEVVPAVRQRVAALATVTDEARHGSS